MPETINFVRERRRQLTKQEVRDRQWFKISTWVAGGVLAVTLVLLGARFWVQRQVGQSLTQQGNLKQEVVSLEAAERSALAFSQKLKILETIFKERSQKQAALEYFTQIFGPTVLIKEIEYEAADHLLTFGLQTTDVFGLERVFQILDGSEVKEKFGSVSRSDLRRAAEGTYSLKVVITMP